MSIIAWPNPVADRLTIQVDDAAENLIINILDITGRSVWKGNFPPGSTVEFVDVSTFGPGMYSILAGSNSFRYVEKLVVLE